MERIGWLLVFGIVGSLGFFALLVVSLIMLREERAAKRARPAGGDDAPEAKAPAAQRRSLFPPRASAPGAHEVLRVLRDHLTGQLIVEIAGRRYTQVGDIQDPNVQRGFMTTLQDLGSFAASATPAIPLNSPADPFPAESTRASGAEGQPQIASPAPETPPIAEPAPRPAPPSPPPTPVPNPPISNLSAPRADEPLQAPSMNPLKQMQVLRERSKQPPPPPPKSIAEQIDEILQEKIAGTPHRQRGLTVHAGPQGHALFGLDGKNYEALDDLPEAEARTLVRAAIAEWEKRQ